jgi:hypothetical protein
MKRIIIAALCFMFISLSACGKQTDVSSGTITTSLQNAVADGLPQFDISSNDLHDGVWDTVITNNDYGKNVSPQLSWEPVEGTKSYVIYMVDTSAGNWLHWRAGNITETTLEQGSATESEYIGPYPPSGTHNYEIYVYAMKADVEQIPGAFDSTNEGFGQFESLFDESGSVIAYGHISGTYTHGDK